VQGMMKKIGIFFLFLQLNLQSYGSEKAFREDLQKKIVMSLDTSELDTQNLIAVIPAFMQHTRDLNLKKLHQQYPKNNNVQSSKKLLHQVLSGQENFIIEQKIKIEQESFVCKQDEQFKMYLEEASFIGEIIDEYDALVGNFNPVNLKKVKDDLVVYCQKVDACAQESFMECINLKARVCSVDSDYFLKMIEYFKGWTLSIQGQDQISIVEHKSLKQVEVDQLKSKIKDLKIKNSDQYLLSLSIQECVKASKELKNLDDQCHRFAIVAMLEKLHGKDCPLELQNLTDK
jgi:hypothetical protein